MAEDNETRTNPPTNNTGRNTMNATTLTAGDVVFVQENEDRWVSQDKRFELTRQDYEAYAALEDPEVPEDDWGVWDTVIDDWAHRETGYTTRDMAVKAFVEAQESRKRFSAAIMSSSPKLWREEE